MYSSSCFRHFSYAIQSESESYILKRRKACRVITLGGGGRLQRKHPKIELEASIVAERILHGT